MATVRIITLRDLLEDPERFRDSIGQPLVDILLDHKSAWIPDSRGGEPNHLKDGDHVTTSQ